MKTVQIAGFTEPNKYLGTDSLGNLVLKDGGGGGGGTDIVSLQGYMTSSATLYPNNPPVSGQMGVGSGALGAIQKGNAWWVKEANTIIDGKKVKIGTLLIALANNPDNTGWLLQEDLEANFELLSNKSNNLVGDQTSTTKYPTVKTVYDYIQGVISAISTALGFKADITYVDSTFVPNTRELTINGTTYDLSANRTWTIDVMSTICPNIVTVDNTPYYTASYGDSVYVDTDAVADNCTITLPTGDTYGGLVYVKNMAEPSTYTVSVSSYVLQNGQWILLRKGKFGAWEIIASSLIDTQSVQNGLKIENNTIKLGGELTDDNTRLTVNSPNKNFFIGAPVNGQDLGFISLSSNVLNINNAVDHDTVQGNTLYITPGGLNSINQFQSGVQTVLNANPEAVVMRYGDNKLINLYIFGGGIIPGGGETLTINDITFTEGIDFIGEGNYVFDTTYILNTLNWNSIPNFVSVTEKTDSFNEPYLEVIFSEIAVVTTTISNLSISNFANENKMLVDKDGVLLRSRNNEITLTNDITSINAKNCNIVQNNEEGVIKNTLYLNAFGSFLSNRDATDSSISSSSISGGFGSNISNFNNKKIGLQISGEILSGESFTVNGITFTEGVDFTTVNDPNLDALAIANIDYSSVPNFVSVSSLNDVITFIFSTIDNTIVSNITNSYVANYLFTTSVFAGKDFALIQSNNSGLQIGDTGHIFSDNTIEKQGIRYAGDYSATYTDRSLIDKAYADSLNTNAVDKDTVKLAENINKGQAVYVSDANGTNIIVSKASNTSEATSSKTFGLLETSGVTNDIVNVVTRGLLTGLDTSAATVGDAVWLGTNGDLLYGLANKPYAPAHLVFIGVVTRHHAVNGEIFVNVQNGFELNEIHNVSITTPANNEVLTYESSTQLWINKVIPTPATPTLDTVTTAGATTANNITVGSTTLSNTTVSTLPFIDTAKKIISATGALLGTWFQTLTADIAPVDADTIIVNDSTASFEAKKTTLLQLWTNYLLGKVQALGYLSGSGLTTNTIPRANSGALQDSYIQEITTNAGGTNGATRPYPSVLTVPSGTGAGLNGFLKWVDNGSTIAQLYIYKPYTNGQGAGWYQILDTQNPSFSALATSSPAFGMGLSNMTNSISTAPTNLYTGEIRNLRVGSQLYGLGVFQAGAGFHYLKPFGGNHWEFTVAVNSYMRDWDWEVIGATANSGKGGGSNTLSNLSKIGNSTVKFRAMANTNSPYYYIEGVFKVNSSGAITSLVITQPSSNTTAFNVSITDTRIQFTGNAFSQAYVICEKIAGQYYGALYTTPYENERYSSDATVKYWVGDLALGSATINARAQLQLQSTSKGFLPNVLTTAQRDAVSWVAGDAGMIIYNSTTNKHQGWNGTTWNDMY